jgi:hypothetical protein
MSRCLSCDAPLTDYESTRKNLNLEFVELCNDCLAAADMEDILLLDRPDLKHHNDARATIDDEDIVDPTLDDLNALEDDYDGFWDER